MRGLLPALVGCYMGILSLTAILLTVLDKRRAKRGGWRVPERTLLLVGLLGGAFPMYLTMRLIHHKTLHKKFMIGLPVIFLLELAVSLLLLIRNYSG